MAIDEEVQARIQEFTSWAVGKGYHVVGGLIGPRGAEKPTVQVFATAPEHEQDRHVERLLEVLNLSVYHGTHGSQLSLPLGKN